jgi:nucleotide-binding universal stress UspA family protein
LEVYEARLRREANHLRLEHGFKFAVEVVCTTGSLLANLNRAVAEQGADLVVMGTKGASSWLDKLIGTTTSAYLREAPCPVLVVPAETELVLPERVAYAADFENEEGAFLRELLPVTRALGAGITIVHVDNEAELNTVPDEQVIDEINQEFPGNTFAWAQIRDRDVAAGLEAFVREGQVPLLALPLRDRGLLETLFHHSITNALAFHARVPLLVLPEKAALPAVAGQAGKEYLIA